MFKFYKVNTNASESKELFFSQDYIESFMQKSALVLWNNAHKVFLKLYELQFHILFPAPKEKWVQSNEIS